jgi:hypothetical protein
MATAGKWAFHWHSARPVISILAENSKPTGDAMESPDRNPNQPGRKDRLPGTGNDDDGDVGTDPRRTREQENERNVPRRDQSRPDQSNQRTGEPPKAG